MTKENNFIHSRRCVFLMHVHLVFITKYRKSVFEKKHILFLEKTFNNICSKFESKLKDCNGESNHIHLLVEYPPKISVSKLTNSLKGVSSRLIKIFDPDIKKYYWKNSLWSPSYFASSCGGAPLSILKNYIKNQNINK